eukprot:5368652-Pyramimonas_sp.AAC.1
MADAAAAVREPTTAVGDEDTLPYSSIGLGDARVAPAQPIAQKRQSDDAGASGGPRMKAAK